MGRAIQEFKAGGIKATVWENEGSKGVFNTITLCKTSVRDDKPSFQNLQLTESDLNKVMLVLRKTEEKLCVKGQDLRI